MATFADDTGTINVSASSTSESAVTFIRDDLFNKFPEYDLVNDCIEGGIAVKKKKDFYLPRPDAANTSIANIARYDAYIKRAIFYNVTKRTANGLLGQIFDRSPVVETPKRLENVVTDSSGSGISLEQLSKMACLLNIGCGRLGLFVDFPPRETAVTKAEQEEGNIRPSVAIFDSKSVINWRTKTIGSLTKLSLVVLKESYTVEDDGFKTQQATQYRELRLDEAGNYSVQLWREKEPRKTDGPSSQFEKFQAAYSPKGGNGLPLRDIPFTFCGSINNEPSIDPAPLYDMAEINIGHYRNSADHEESVYVVGQPTLVISGLTADWFKTTLKGEIPFGSRSGIPLPVGATAELIQMEPNTAAKESMEHKERQMVALGARIVQNREVQRTATDAVLETSSEDSQLVTIAKNVSLAMKWALEWCAVFQGVAETGIKFELNTDFALAKLTGAEISAVIGDWQSEAISWTEMRAILRKAGRTSQTDEEAKAEIEKDSTAAIERAAAEIGATTKAVTDNSAADTGGTLA